MSKQMEQYNLLKAIIDKELGEIDEEMTTQDNSDVSSAVKFHIEHGVRDVEERIAGNGTTELELPYGISDSMKCSMNELLLNVEALLQYYYQACYFGSREQVEHYRQNILEQLKEFS